MNKTKNDSAKLRYPKILELSLIVSIVIVTAGLQISPGKPEPMQLRQPDLPITIEDVVSIVPEKAPRKPPKPGVPVAALEPELLEAPDSPVSELFLETIPEPPRPPDRKILRDEPEIPFLLIEDQPELIGGTEFIYANVRYPVIARKAGIEGDVRVAFLIDKNGNVSKIEILAEDGNIGFGEAAREVLAGSRWNPGKQRGLPVACLYEMTIRFRLTK